MTLMKTLLYSLWLSINIIVVGLTAYHLIKLEKEINAMAVYNSTHTGQEIDNAVDKLKDVTKDNIDSIKNIKLYKHTVGLAFSNNTTSNNYQITIEFYTMKQTAILSLSQLAEILLGEQGLKEYKGLFSCKEMGNSIYYIGIAFYKGKTDNKYYIDYISDGNIVTVSIDNELGHSDNMIIM